MNTDKQSKTTRETTTADAEALASLLLELEDALAAATLVSDTTSTLTRKRHTQAAAIQERLNRLSTLHAPWLHLGRSRLRWLVAPLNLLILPWGRKQAAYNADVQQSLQALAQMTNEMLDTTDAITRLESRVTRIESLIRQLLTHKPTTRGDLQKRVDNF